MTTIREFRISGLAGRTVDLHRTLREDVNIFWGLNGTGKTTLLRILDAALNNSTDGLSSLPFTAAEVRIYSEAYGMDVVRTYSKEDEFDRERQTPQSLLALEEMGVDDDLLGRLRLDEADPGWNTEPSFAPRSNREWARFKHSYLSITRMNEIGRFGRQRDELSMDEQFAQRVNSVWSRYSMRSLAEIRDIQQSGLAEVLAILFGGTANANLELESRRNGESEVAISASSAFSIVSEFLRRQQIKLPLGEEDFTARYDESAHHRHVVTRIQSVMRQIDHVLAPQQELQTVISEMYIGNKQLVLNRQGKTGQRVAVEIDDEAIPLTSLSSGEKQLLQILLETLAVEGSTIMIDEPEISLHPDWQQGLVNSMRRVNPNGQFVLATHSPELMIGVPEECVFEL